jgi:4-amino-4-deoxy-L-arabinose transferase-like glycosyltransferase
MDETMEDSIDGIAHSKSPTSASRTLGRSFFWTILIFAAAVYIGCIFSPPSLMDDVDAVQAQIAQNMVHSGDWVTARLDGVPYLEKPPLIYWMIAVSYEVLGIHDWVARIPEALSAIALCLVTAAFAAWAFGDRVGFYAGLCMSTCLGLFLFTRILLPDALLTLTIILAMWALLRVLEEEEQHPRVWATVFAVCLAIGLLLKSLIGIVFPIGAAAIYLLCTRQLFSAYTWRRLRPISGLAIILLIAAPWHVLATLRNPPYFSFTLRSVPGEYHGFLWFFLMNEQVLRFLNLRYPRDYDTVPRLYFWLFNLLWLFPWSVYLPAAARGSYRPVDRAGRARLVALCLIGFVMVFFTLSTTQEYYSMPIYPALALLIGAGMDSDGKLVWGGTRVLTVFLAIGAVAAIAILVTVRHVPAPGDISHALSYNPNAYKLSLGHMEDLTIKSFAYLRLPLALAAGAFLLAAAGTLQTQGRRMYVTVAVAMVIFFHAARIAMVRFDPYLSSRPLIADLQRSPPGNLIIDHHYYWYSSVFFYTDRSALLLNGRFFNMVYGSYAPGAHNAFIDDTQFRDLWQEGDRYYIITKGEGADRLKSLVGADKLFMVGVSGGKFLFTNHPVPSVSDRESGVGSPTK